MSEKMEELKPTPRGLNLNDGWEQQVNGKAKRTDDRLEMEKKYAAEKEKKHRAEKRATRMLRMFCLGLALIAAGGIYMGTVEEIPKEIAIAVVISGVGLSCFTVGLLAGRSQRR